MSMNVCKQCQAEHMSDRAYCNRCISRNVRKMNEIIKIDVMTRNIKKMIKSKKQKVAG
jgi:hypothetical protein